MELNKYLQNEERLLSEELVLKVPVLSENLSVPSHVTAGATFQGRVITASEMRKWGLREVEREAHVVDLGLPGSGWLTHVLSHWLPAVVAVLAGGGGSAVPCMSQVVHFLLL